MKLQFMSKRPSFVKQYLKLLETVTPEEAGEAVYRLATEMWADGYAKGVRNYERDMFELKKKDEV